MIGNIVSLTFLIKDFYLSIKKIFGVMNGVFLKVAKKVLQKRSLLMKKVTLLKKKYLNLH